MPRVREARVRNRVRRRRFAMTLNNPTLSESVQWNTVLLEGNDAEHAQDLTFFIVQTEKGDGTVGDSALGTIHYQAYCEFKKKTSWSTIKEIFGDRVHIENAFASGSANIKYCSKERTRYGELAHGIRGHWGSPKKSGSVQMAAIEALSGESLDKIVSDYPMVALLHMPKLENLIAYAKGPRTEVPRIIILTGLTGCGKSQYCVKHFSTSAYWVPPPDSGRVWFGHYVGQDVAIFDDFHSGWFTLTHLLRIFDSTPLMVAPKGGQVPFNSGMIVLTMNGDPKDLYLHYKGLKSHKDALERRFQDFAEIYDCTVDVFDTGMGHSLRRMVRTKRTEEFKFNEDDFSQPAGVGDMTNGNGFGRTLPYGTYN